MNAAGHLRFRGVLLVGLTSLVAGTLQTCPGEGRFAPTHSCDNGVFKICAKLLDAPGTSNLQAWGTKDYFAWMKQADPSAALSMMQSKGGDHACISLDTFSTVSQLAGCANVHISCEASNIVAVLGEYATKGLDDTANCLRQRCPAQPTAAAAASAIMPPAVPAPSPTLAPAAIAAAGTAMPQPAGLQPTPAPSALPQPKGLTHIPTASTAPSPTPAVPHVNPAPSPTPSLSLSAPSPSPSQIHPAPSPAAPSQTAAAVGTAPSQTQAAVGVTVPGRSGLWYTAPTVGMSCNEVCTSQQMVFDAVSSQHIGNQAGMVLHPMHTPGQLWKTVECSSTDNNKNWGANGNTPDADWKNPGCNVNCACKSGGAAASLTVAVTSAPTSVANPMQASTPSLSKLSGGTQMAMADSPPAAVGATVPSPTPALNTAGFPAGVQPGFVPTPAPQRGSSSSSGDSSSSSGSLGVVGNILSLLICLGCCASIAACIFNPRVSAYADQHLHKHAPELHRNVQGLRQHADKFTRQRYGQQYSQQGSAQLYQGPGQDPGGRYGGGGGGYGGGYEERGGYGGAGGSYGQQPGGSFPRQQGGSFGAQVGSFHGAPVTGQLSGGHGASAYGPAPPADSYNYRQQSNQQGGFRHDAYRNPYPGE